MEGDVFGTPAYMPPEQAAGRIAEIDERSDVFSLGATLYKILTHEAPFDGASVTEVLHQAVECAPRPPRAKSPWNRIPAELESICLEAMARRPGDRYSSVEALTEDLRAYLDHRPVKAHRYGPLTRLLRFVQRHPGGSLTGTVAVILLSLGSASVGMFWSRAEANAARASEQEARARAQTARAETESLRAEAAVLEKEHAETRANTAEAFLEKGRRVSAVLRSAHVELEDEYRALVRGFYSARTMATVRKESAAVWSRVEAFEASVPGDKTSRSVWFALKGWLRFHAGYDEEAILLFRRSDATDPDVAYGALFDATIWLSHYFVNQNLPAGIIQEGVLRFEEVPPETPRMKKLRELFASSMAQAEGRGVWGETSVAEFKEVLSGFRALQEGDLEEAERGLTKALAVPEMVWLAGDVLLARARVRYLRQAFSEGIADIEKARILFPLSPKVHFVCSQLWMGSGMLRHVRGEDPRADFKKALEALDDALERDEDFCAALHDKGLLFMYVGKAEAVRGGDPLPSFRKAEEAWDEALRIAPDYFKARLNRVLIRSEIAKHHETLGRDPRPGYQRVLDELAEILKEDPESELVRYSRTQILMDLAHAVQRRGLDARVHFEAAAAEYGRILARNPGHAGARSNRASALIGVGDAERARRRDPRPFFEEAAREAEEAVRQDPDNPTSHHILGNAHLKIGTALLSQKLDPRKVLEKAVSALDRSLACDPDREGVNNNRAIALYLIARELGNRGLDPRAHFERAIADFEQAMKQAPRSPYVYIYGARACRSLGYAQDERGEASGDSFAKAIDYFEGAYERDPNLWQALVDKGRLLAAVGRFQECADAYEASLKKAGNQSPALRDWLALAQEAARGAEWEKKIRHADFLATRGAFGPAKKLLDEGFEGAKKAGAAEEKRFHKVLFTGHLRYACILAQASKGKRARKAEPVPPGEAEAETLRAKALDHIRKASDLGCLDLRFLTTQPDLAPLRSLPEFARIVKQWEAKARGG